MTKFVNLELDLILRSEDEQPVKALLIRNGGETLDHITLQITSSGEALLPLSLELDRLEADGYREIPLAEQLCLNREYLQHLCHSLTTEVVVAVMQAGVQIAGAAWQVTLEGGKDEK